MPEFVAVSVAVSEAVAVIEGVGVFEREIVVESDSVIDDVRECVIVVEGVLPGLTVA